MASRVKFVGTPLLNGNRIRRSLSLMVTVDDGSEIINNNDNNSECENISTRCLLVVTKLNNNNNKFVIFLTIFVSLPGTNQKQDYDDDEVK